MNEQDSSALSVGALGQMSRRRMLGLTVGGGATFLLASCASDDAETTPSVNTSTTTKASAITKTALAQTIHGLSFAPVYLARDAGYFKEAGVDLNWQLVKGDSQASAAMVSNDVQFVASSYANILRAAASDVDFVAVCGVASTVTLEMLVTRKWAEENDLTPESPLQDKLDAFKGKTFGSQSLGGGPDQLTRWLMVQGGYAKDDVEIAALGGAPETIAALQNGHLDGCMLSPPWGPSIEKDGWGMRLLVPAEVERWRDFPWEIISTTREFSEQSPEVVRAVVSAIAKANDVIRDSPEEAIEVLTVSFKDTDPEVVEASVHALRESFAEGGVITESSIENLDQFLTDLSPDEERLDTAEDELWTAEFAK